MFRQVAIGDIEQAIGAYFYMERVAGIVGLESVRFVSVATQAATAALTFTPTE